MEILRPEFIVGISHSFLAALPVLKEILTLGGVMG